MPQRISSAEYTRLAALYRCGILDTEADPAFDGIVRDLAVTLRVPVAQLVFADVERFWATSSVGSAATESLRGGTLADLLISDQPTLLVTDAGSSSRMPGDLPPSAVPLLSFAGIRVTSPEDDAIGVLLVADTQPRQFSAGETAAVEAAAHRLSPLIEDRRRARHDTETGALVCEAFADTVRRMVGAARTGRQRLSLVRMDLAAFRASLERMGTGLGRIALRRMADISLHQVRRRDCFGRLGLEAFGLLLTDTGEAGADVLARRLSTLLVQGWSEAVPDTGAIRIAVRSVKPQPGDDAEAVMLAFAAGQAAPAWPVRPARSA